MKYRRVRSSEEFNKVVDEIGGGWKATICSIGMVEFRKTNRSINYDQFASDYSANRENGDDNIYNLLNSFASGTLKTFPFTGMIKVSRIKTNWMSSNRFGINYSKFFNNVENELRPRIMRLLKQRLGRMPSEAEIREYMPARKDVQDTSLKNGALVGNSETTKHTQYVNYNYHPSVTERLGSEYYVVDENGNLTKIPTKVAYHLYSFAKEKKMMGVKYLEQLNAPLEEIEEYAQKIKNLGYLPSKMKFDSVLYIAAATDKRKTNGEENEGIVLYNDKASTDFIKLQSKAKKDGTRSIDYEVHVNPAELASVVKKMIQRDYSLVLEGKQRKKSVIRLTEQDITRLVRRTVQRILSENNSSK